MRFFRRKNYRIKEEVIIKKFAWLPIHIGTEIRWLEWVKIRTYYGVINNTHWEYKEFLK